MAIRHAPISVIALPTLVAVLPLAGSPPAVFLLVQMGLAGVVLLLLTMRGSDSAPLRRRQATPGLRRR